MGAFKTPDYYKHLIAGAHRRRVTPIGAPALVRHLVFWNPIKAEQLDEQSTPGHQDEGASKPSEHDRRKHRVKAADAFVAAIYKSLRTLNSSEITRLRTRMVDRKTSRAKPVFLFRGAMSEIDGSLNYDEKLCADVDSYRAIKIFCEWQGLPTTLSFELHVEFMTMTVVVDISAHKTKAQIAVAAAAPANAAFRDLRDRLAAVGDLFSARDVKSRKWVGHHRFLYYEMWERFDASVFVSAGLDKLTTPKGVWEPERYVDFRGVVLNVEKRREEKRIRPPLMRRPHFGVGDERDPICDIDDFDRIWPLMKRGFPLDTEFSLSRFIGKRAFFATALGEQSGMVEDSKSGPLCYFFLEDTLNTWQLGRLVYRIHRAGTARLSAAMHFENIQAANDILSNAEQRLQSALQEATLPTEEDEDRERDALTRVRRHNAAIERELSRISESRRLDGTLDFRIERSRYYVSQFARITKSLRIERVAGFQTYKEFVQQRLGPVFEYIDRIGQRHSRVQSDRGLLTRRLTTLEALYEERLISRTQRVADIALYGVLGPYYLMHIVEYADLLPKVYLWRIALVYSGLYLGMVITKATLEWWAQRRSRRASAKPDKDARSRRGIWSYVRAGFYRVYRIRVLACTTLALTSVTAFNLSLLQTGKAGEADVQSQAVPSASEPSRVEGPLRAQSQPVPKSGNEMPAEPPLADPAQPPGRIATPPSNRAPLRPARPPPARE